jgi:transposase
MSRGYRARRITERPCRRPWQSSTAPAGRINGEPCHRSGTGLGRLAMRHLQQRSELLTWVGSMVNHGDMKAYSEDLRQKVVEAVEQRGTTSKSEAARLFGISLSSVKRYTRLASQGESLTPRKGGGRPPIADEMTRTLLEEDIRARPAATVKERRHFLESFAGKTMSEPTLRRLLKRMGFSRKKGVWGRWNETNGKEQPGE